MNWLVTISECPYVIVGENKNTNKQHTTGSSLVSSHFHYTKDFKGKEIIIEVRVRFAKPLLSVLFSTFFAILPKIQDPEIPDPGKSYFAFK